jgi:predicted metal-binding protein
MLESLRQNEKNIRSIHRLTQMNNYPLCNNALWEWIFMLDGEELITMALESNAAHAAILDTAAIQFHDDFRKACEKNLCGKYDTNWMGPPAIGPIKMLKERTARYRRGLLFQTVHPIAGNFDMKGMFEAAGIHSKIFRDLLEKIRQKYPQEVILPLDAGCCSICEKCAYLDGKLCRHPDQAVSSVEAYGMNVLALEKCAGIPYYHGKNRVSYVGLILFDIDGT